MINEHSKTSPKDHLMRIRHIAAKRVLLLMAFIFGLARPACAQEGNPPITNMYAPDTDSYDADIFAGMGATSDGSLAGQFGASVGTRAITHANGIGFMQFLETGAIVTRSAPATFLGYDLGIALLPHPHSHSIFFAAGGYSYIFTQGNALNFSVGSDFFYTPQRAIRVELRDYVGVTGKSQHTVALRVGWHFTAHNT
jgi:hypothetical protein